MPLWFGFLVAAQLPDGLALPLLHHRRGFGLDDDQGDAVDEEDQVGLDYLLVVLGRGAFVGSADAELGGDDVLVEADVGLGMIEVEEADGRRLLASVAFDREGHAVGEVFVDALVAAQAGLVDLAEVEDNPLGLVFGHPLVEAQEGGGEAVFEDDFALVGALVGQGFAGDVGPAEGDEEVAGGYFGVGQFVGLVRGGHGGGLRERIRLPDRSRRRGGLWRIGVQICPGLSRSVWFCPDFGGVFR